MNETALVLVAHGTRSSRGVEMIATLADAVAEQVGPTRVAFVDVLGPSPSEVLRDITGPAVVVPAFLASGYHVHTDVPREVADSGHPSVAVTRALGPDPVLAEVLLRRLVDAGWQPGMPSSSLQRDRPTHAHSVTCAAPPRCWRNSQRRGSA